MRRLSLLGPIGTNVKSVETTHVTGNGDHLYGRSMNETPRFLKHDNIEATSVGNATLLSAPVTKAIATQKTTIAVPETATSEEESDSMEGNTKRGCRERRIKRYGQKKQSRRDSPLQYTGDDASFAGETSDASVDSNVSSATKSASRTSRVRGHSETRSVAESHLTLRRQEWNRKRRKWTKELRKRMKQSKGDPNATKQKKRNWRERLKVALACTAIAGASGGAVYTYLTSCVNAEECGRAISQFAEQAWREINNVSG